MDRTSEPTPPRRGRRRPQKNRSDEPVDHSLGRSRGGWGSKIHLVTCGNGAPLAATVTARQAHESKRFETVIESVRPRRRRPMWVLGDEGYSYARVRRWCERRGIFDVIPQRSDQLAREGRRVFSRTICKGRNVVERCVGWLKHNRRLGTRYEKLAVHYIAMLKLALISRYLRLLEPSDTT
ncbi:MAG: IS5 family transposase [Myxococcota bacterium]